MEKEIKKKIEDEAYQYDNSTPSDSCNEELAFIKGAEYGYSLAQQNVNSELLRQVQRLTTWIRMEGNDDDVEMILEAEEVMSRAESLLSASQNQQNEKESDAVNPIELLEWLSRQESDISIIYGGTPELKKDYRFAGEDNDYSIDEVIELFKESKTK